MLNSVHCACRTSHLLLQPESLPTHQPRRVYALEIRPTFRARRIGCRLARSLCSDSRAQASTATRLRSYNPGAGRWLEGNQKLTRPGRRSGDLARANIIKCRSMSRSFSAPRPRRAAETASRRRLHIIASSNRPGNSFPGRQWHRDGKRHRIAARSNGSCGTSNALRSAFLTQPGTKSARRRNPEMPREGHLSPRNRFVTSSGLNAGPCGRRSPHLRSWRNW